MPPVVSVVIATYNRSNALHWTLRSLQRQTVADWEAWIVGDACTDDTARVVHELGDDRLQFVNLERNCGDQSGPNNEGVRRARGRWLAFLNHDDLWWEDHLAACLEPLEAGDADLVWGLTDRVLSQGGRWLDGGFLDNRYTPGPLVPASSWVLRRSLADEVGPWRHRHEIRDIPSQDWLFRAWRSGARMRAVRRLTVMAFGSGGRPGSYARRDEHEQREAFGRLVGDPTHREEELTRILWSQPHQFRNSRVFVSSLRAKHLLMALPLRWTRWWMLAMGVNPVEGLRALKGVRRGAFVDELRRRRGLTELAPGARGRTAGAPLEEDP